jgi:transposase-like protein
MGRQTKFTDEQKAAIVIDLLSEKISHAEVCRKYGISSTYAYKLRDRGMEILRNNIGRQAGRPDAQTEQLKKRIEDLEQLAGDQALAIRYLKKTQNHG